MTCFLLTGLLFSSTLRVGADAIVYWDFDNGFTPDTIVIGPGETVTWWNFDPYGFDLTITFDNGLNFSLVDSQNQSVVFPSQAGTYGYHSDWGNRGAVIVDIPPSVIITSPPNNAVFPSPATFTIRATAAASADGLVTDVQFLLGTTDGTNVIDDVLAAPFNTSVTNLAAGTYVVMAVATDSYGMQATNAILVTVGEATGVNLHAPRIVSTKFLFDVSGLTPGKTNVLQSSTNLVAWKPAITNLAASATMTVTNAIFPGSHYYRILQLP